MTLDFVQFFHWPIVIVVFFRDVELVPLALASLFVSHFLAYGWFYRRRGYALLGIGGLIVATAWARARCSRWLRAERELLRPIRP